MKKFITYCAAFMATIGIVNAQSQRFSIYEEFTGENCPPCAATNPGLDKLLIDNVNNTKKTLLVRFQVPIPSAPPANSLYGQSKSFENLRRNYYNVPFAPYARLNGTEVPDPGGQSNGHAGLINQQIIDDSYAAMDAPFTMSLSHTINEDATSIHVTGTATCTKASTGTFTLQLYLIEKEIHFAKPTGTNGEKDFYNVVRGMYPDSKGTAIGTSFTVNQTYNIDATISVPSYIYGKSRLAVVAFIQNDADQTIQQGVISQPAPLQLDASIAGIKNVPVLLCSNNLNAAYSLLNAGITPLTSATITYQIDNTTANTINWTGNLASGATVDVNLPVLTPSAGSHTLKVRVSLPNGTTEIDTTNNNKSTTFLIEPPATAAPLIQNYNTAAFPPANWSVINEGGDGSVWLRRTGAGAVSGNGSAYINTYKSGLNKWDKMILPTADLSQAGSPNVLSFYRAYKRLDAQSYDILVISVSTDCGKTWNDIAYRNNEDLKTSADDNQLVYANPVAADWVKDSVWIPTNLRASEALIQFAVSSGDGAVAPGNTLHLDQINLYNSTLSGISTVKSNSTSFEVYPNPSNGTTNLTVNAPSNGDLKVKITNPLGQVVSSYNETLTAGKHAINLNTENLSAGIYFVDVTLAGNKYTEKLVISK